MLFCYIHKEAEVTQIVEKVSCFSLLLFFRPTIFW